MDRTPTSIPVRTLPARIALYANVLIIAVSLVSIIGWICKTPALASWGHAYKPIAISVAMYFLLLSALFLAKTIRPKSALLGASLMIVALAAIGQNVILILSKGYLFTAIDLITQGKSMAARISAGAMTLGRMCDKRMRQSLAPRDRSDST